MNIQTASNIFCYIYVDETFRYGPLVQTLVKMYVPPKQFLHSYTYAFGCFPLALLNISHILSLMGCLPLAYNYVAQ